MHPGMKTMNAMNTTMHFYANPLGIHPAEQYSTMNGTESAVSTYTRYPSPHNPAHSTIHNLNHGPAPPSPARGGQPDPVQPRLVRARAPPDGDGDGHGHGHADADAAGVAAIAGLSPPSGVQRGHTGDVRSSGRLERARTDKLLRDVWVFDR
ncbi:hypothetical protein BDW75DRAFT_11676 [Aspergillus navahoensis]